MHIYAVYCSNQGKFIYLLNIYHFFIVKTFNILSSSLFEIYSTLGNVLLNDTKSMVDNKKLD
jgi:hypothetical protein